MTKQFEGMLMNTLKELCDQVTELNIKVNALERKGEIQVMEIRSRKERNK